MSIFRKNLKPVWTFKSDKKVWRLLPGSGVLAAELRDTEAKVADYTGIDIASGSTLWQGVRLDDSWWVIMNTIHRDVLLLQQFVKPNMPTPASIFAVDLFTGKLLWQNKEIGFLNASGDTIYCFRSSVNSDEILALDYRTGAEKERFNADDARAHELIIPNRPEEYLLPEFLEEMEGIIPGERVEVLKRAAPSGAQRTTLIPSVSGKDIMGYYSDAGTDEKDVQIFDSNIIVVDGSGNEIFRDVADRNVYTTFGDFYFVTGTMLIYARNSNEIVAIDLTA